MTQNIPAHGSNIARKDINEIYKWKIDDLYADKESWQAAAQNLKAELSRFEEFKGRLGDAEILLQALQKQAKLSEEISKIYAYARLQLDADNTDPALQAMSGEAESLLADFNNAVSFVEPEIISLSKDYLESCLAEPSFNEFKFYLANLLRLAPHVLPQEQEALLSQASLAMSAPAAIFRSLVSADMEFPPITDGKGNTANVSEGNYLLNMTSADRTLRKNSFRTLMGTYHNYRNTLANTLTGQCRVSRFYATAHKYEDTLTASLAEDNIPTELYHKLIETVHNNLEPLHEYIAIKKAALKLDELHPYDLYMPLSSAGESFACTFEEACERVAEALAPLGEDYISTLKHAFKSRWIDIYENKGKRSGAYSWGIYGVHPYVLLNYQPRYNSISTIAHEMATPCTATLPTRRKPILTVIIPFSVPKLPAQQTKFYFWNTHLPMLPLSKKFISSTSFWKQCAPRFTARYNLPNLNFTLTEKLTPDAACRQKTLKTTGWKATKPITARLLPPIKNLPANGRAFRIFTHRFTFINTQQVTAPQPLSPKQYSAAQKMPLKNTSVS